MPTKLCKDCRHGKIEKSERYERGACWHDVALDVVTGISRVTCSTMRERQSVCGEDGKLWEALKPTVHDLEKLLEVPDEQAGSVTIKPDGSIEVTTR